MNQTIAIRVIRGYAILFWLAALSAARLTLSSLDIVLYGEYGHEMTSAGIAIVVVAASMIALMAVTGVLLWLRRTAGRTAGLIAAVFAMLFALPYLELDHILRFRSLLGLLQLSIFALGIIALLNRRIRMALS